MPQEQLKLASGSSIVLGAQLGRGGEGAVYELHGSDYCAKIYHQPLSAERTEKIRVMSARSNPQIAAVASWPLDLVLNKSGKAVGLMMPKVAGRKDIHVLYSPKSRRAEFVRADWRFIIRSCVNIARSFALIHQNDYVIGDVNHGSVLVSQDARVTIVDCDSFQVTSGSRNFLCDKGVETYTPPELQGKSLSGLIRTKDHDNFGLAVLIFHLLMMGRHPFAGRYSGAGEMMIAKAIEERRFAYGRDRRNYQMDQPPNTPDLDIVGFGCRDLFERAFTTRVAGTRPTPEDWLRELQGLEKQVLQCGANDAHWHLRGLPNGCPWCAMERSSGAILFPYVMQAGSGGSVLDVGGLTQKVYALGSLGAAPEIGRPEVSASPKALAVKSERKKLVLACFALSVTVGAVGLVFGSLFLAAAGVGLGWLCYRVIADRDTSARDLREEAQSAEQRYEAMIRRWKSECDGAKFGNLRAEFQNLKSAWDRLPQERIRRLEALSSQRQRFQLERYLDRFRIEHAKIPGVGPGRKAILASDAIETAFDVTEAKLLQLPSFGPTSVQRMLQWRREIEAKFVFDTRAAVDPAQIAAVEQDILSQRKRLELQLRDKYDAVTTEHARVTGMRAQMKPHVEEAVKLLTQAQFDLRVIS